MPFSTLRRNRAGPAQVGGGLLVDGAAGQRVEQPRLPVQQTLVAAVEILQQTIGTVPWRGGGSLRSGGDPDSCGTATQDHDQQRDQRDEPDAADGSGPHGGRHRPRGGGVGGLSRRVVLQIPECRVELVERG
jgi:hypothetical protein